MSIKFLHIQSETGIFCTPEYKKTRFYELIWSFISFYYIIWFIRKLFNVIAMGLIALKWERSELGVRRSLVPIPGLGRRQKGGGHFAFPSLHIYGGSALGHCTPPPTASQVLQHSWPPPLIAHCSFFVYVFATIRRVKRRGQISCACKTYLRNKGLIWAVFLRTFKMNVS